MEDPAYLTPGEEEADSEEEEESDDEEGEYLEKGEELGFRTRERFCDDTSEDNKVVLWRTQHYLYYYNIWRKSLCVRKRVPSSPRSIWNQDRERSVSCLDWTNGMITYERYGDDPDAFTDRLTALRMQLDDLESGDKYTVTDKEKQRIGASCWVIDELREYNRCNTRKYDDQRLVSWVKAIDVLSSDPLIPSLHRCFIYSWIRNLATIVSLDTWLGYCLYLPDSGPTLCMVKNEDFRFRASIFGILRLRARDAVITKEAAEKNQLVKLATNHLPSDVYRNVLSMLVAPSFDSD